MADLFHLITPDIYPEVTKIRTQLIKLSPFFNSIVVYFVFVRDPHGELHTTILKCIPILFLMFYLVMKGFDFSKKYHYSQRIMAGLGFSVCGDALLNIGLFPHGMGAFALAHICYISAFGWKPIRLPIGIGIHLIGIALVIVLFDKLDIVLKIGLPLYDALLLTTCWRAIARASKQMDFLSIFCAIGCIVFAISDSLIGIDMFLVKIPYARLWIMSTYYFAQFAITVSSAFERKEDLIPKRRTQKRVPVTERPNLRHRFINKD